MAILEGNVRVAVPDTSYVDNRQVGQRTSSFAITAEYTNYSDSMIYAKTQANIPFAIEPAASLVSGHESRPHLEVRMTYQLHCNEGILGTMEILRALEENDHLQSDEAKKLCEKLTLLYQKDGSRSSKTNFAFYIFRRIMVTDIDRTHAVYFKECDLILTKEREMLAKPHPNSSIGLQQSELFGLRREAGQAGIFIKVVDNENLSKLRYYFAGKQLITVPSVVDDNTESGVYYTIATQKEDGSVVPDTKYATFEEANELLGLYVHKDDALTHGSPDLILKLEESRNKAEVHRANIELTRLKSQNEQRASENERELIELRRALELQKSMNETLKDNLALGKTVREDADVEKRKGEKSRAKEEMKKEHKKLKGEQKKFSNELKKLHLERQQLEEERAAEREKTRLDTERRQRENYYDQLDKDRKDHYEHRSYERKDTSELIKFIPAVILGVVGTIAIMKSKQSSVC